MYNFGKCTIQIKNYKKERCVSMYNIGNVRFKLTKICLERFWLAHDFLFYRIHITMNQLSNNCLQEQVVGSLLGQVLYGCRQEDIDQFPPAVRERALHNLARSPMQGQNWLPSSCKQFSRNINSSVATDCRRTTVNFGLAFWAHHTHTLHPKSCSHTSAENVR